MKNTTLIYLSLLIIMIIKIIIWRINIDIPFSNMELIIDRLAFGVMVISIIIEFILTIGSIVWWAVDGDMEDPPIPLKLTPVYLMYIIHKFLDKYLNEKDEQSLNN